MSLKEIFDNIDQLVNSEDVYRLIFVNKQEIVPLTDKSYVILDKSITSNNGIYMVTPYSIIKDSGKGFKKVNFPTINNWDSYVRRNYEIN